MEYRRNEETGKVEIWSDGKKVGEVITISDILSEVEIPVEPEIKP